MQWPSRFGGIFHAEAVGMGIACEVQDAIAERGLSQGA